VEDHGGWPWQASQGLAMPGCTVILWQLAVPNGQASEHALTCLIVLAVWTALILLMLLAKIALLHFVEHPLHVVNAPVKGFLANLLLFWLIVLWRDLFHSLFLC
jgi:hypothetical protein